MSLPPVPDSATLLHGLGRIRTDIMTDLQSAALPDELLEP